MGWWTNTTGRYAKLPKDAVWGAGAGDQVLLVIPSLNLIVVRNGQTIEPPPPDSPDVFAAYHDPRAKILFEPLVEAITDKPQPAGKAPAPPRSPVIEEIRWAPPETIVRKADGGDNWPMTWADDDALYTAYGDGNGFEPFIAEKLSLGFAKITGAPPDFKGDNLRSPTGEARGQGAAGKKASGLLMVDGVLYLWRATPPTRSSPGRVTAARPGPGRTGNSPRASAVRPSSTSDGTTPARATSSSMSTRPTTTRPTRSPTVWLWRAFRGTGSRTRGL